MFERANDSDVADTAKQVVKIDEYEEDEKPTVLSLKERIEQLEAENRSLRNQNEFLT